MTRRLNDDLKFVGDPVCEHCDAPFQKPYQRMPEAEGTTGNLVLWCPKCRCMTPFQIAEDRCG